MNKVYRFHCAAEIDVRPTPLLLSKRKRRDAKALHFVAADELTITDTNGTRPIEAFEELSTCRAATLTRREADLISLANPGLRPPLALEEMHPWLPRRSFVPSSMIGYRSLMETQARFGPHLISASTYCDQKWNTICNALRRKTSLDQRFYHAWHVPIQDVFVLEEKRADRAVIALDVNAMYSACMQHDIPNPAAIRHIVLERNYQAGEDLTSGLYRCILSGPRTNFIREYNPFTTFFGGKRLRAPLDEVIEVDLNEFEVAYFGQHFSQIYLVDGIVSDEEVPHPLARESRRTFARRMNFKQQGNKPHANREKYLATLLSSCSNRPGRKSEKFPNRDDAMIYLSREHGISPPFDESEPATASWISRSKTVKVTPAAGEVAVVTPDHRDMSTCYMLGQRIVAHGRIHLLKLMERVLAIDPDAQICYVNIDSVHFSLPTERLENALGCLQAEASEAMGAFKIEAVTRHGLWLEPGRYWLYSDDVVKFKNRSIGDGIRPFKEHAHYVASRLIGDLHIPIITSVRMAKSLSYIRTLHEAGEGIVKQRLIERSFTSSFSGTLDALESSRRSTTPKRLKAFEDLKRLMEQPCSVASEQG